MRRKIGSRSKLVYLTAVCAALGIFNGCAHKSATRNNAQDISKEESIPRTRSLPSTARRLEGKGGARDKRIPLSAEIQAPTVDETVVLPAHPGPAAELVRSLFRNWKSERYREMHEQLICRSTSAEFISALRNTPIRWKKVKILREIRDGNAWYVELSAEVTDLQSVMGAFLFNHRPDYPFHEEVSRENPIPAKPANLLIETFTTVKQTWHVVPADNAFRIEVAQQEMDRKCRDKLLEYVVDATKLTYVSDEYGSVMFSANVVLITDQLSDDLGISGDDVNLMPEMIEKADQAKKFFDSLCHSIGKAIGEE